MDVYMQALHFSRYQNNRIFCFSFLLRISRSIQYIFMNAEMSRCFIEIARILLKVFHLRKYMRIASTSYTYWMSRLQWSARDTLFRIPD